MISERPPLDRRLVPPKYKISPLRTNQRLLGIPDSCSRVSDYNRPIQCLILLVSSFFRDSISLVGSSSTSVAHTP